jgi:hypothetical protein
VSLLATRHDTLFSKTFVIYSLANGVQDVMNVTKAKRIKEESEVLILVAKSMPNFWEVTSIILGEIYRFWGRIF